MKTEIVFLAVLLVCIALTLSACTPQQIAEVDTHQKEVLVTYTTQQLESPQMVNTFTATEMAEIINPYFSVQNSTGEIFRVDHAGNFYLYPLTTCGKLYTDGAGLLTCGTDADTADTNASTACSGAEVLYGNGTCAEVPALEVTYYNATSTLVITGTGAGALSDIQTYNQITYNVTEDASDFELRVNFTGITEFTTLLVRHKTDVDAGNIAAIQIWDYDSSSWEGYGYLTESITSEIKTLGVYDDSEHIQDGIVQVRFYQDEPATPPTTHIHQFDWVALSKGFGTPVGQEIDPIYSAWDKDYNDLINKPTIFGNTTEEIFNAVNNESFYLLSNPYNFYNASDFVITDYVLSSVLLSYGYYNASDFVISDYSTTTQANLLYAPAGYGDDFNKTYTDTLYPAINYNPFNQSLNTTDDVEHNDLTINSIIFDENKSITFNTTCMIFKVEDTYIDLCR